MPDRWTRLEHTVQLAREALNSERPALVEAEAERQALATRRLPATVEEEAAEGGAERVRRYQALGLECEQRAAAIADLERLFPAPEQSLPELVAAIGRLLEAIVTVEREAFVQRVREGGELEHLRAHLEQLRVKANMHEAEINEWSQRIGRPLRVPGLTFPWPPAPIWDALLAAPVEAPRLLWDDDPNGPNA